MSSKRYGKEFKIEAVKQITEPHYSVAGVSARLGAQHSLYMELTPFRRRLGIWFPSFR